MDLTLSPMVRWTEIDDVVFILDLGKESYHALEPEFTEGWKRLTNASHDAQSPADASLLGHARENGWLIERGHQQVLDEIGEDTLFVRTRMIERLPPAFSAWLCLARAGRALRQSGLRPLLSAMERATAVPQLPRMTEKAAKDAFLRAERLYISKLGAEDCLPRSIALFFFLRSRAGLRVSHHIGIARYPFCAHAWVSSASGPILDKADRIASFSEISLVGRR